MDERLHHAQRWLRSLGLEGYVLAPASSDASFRRYFRLSWPGGVTRILMDAPPPQEDCVPYVRVAAAMRGFGLQVPEVLAEDLHSGYLLLSDLGHTPYLQALTDASVDGLYGDALEALARLQLQPVEGAGLPEYDRELLQREMQLFPDWFLDAHLGIRLDDAETAVLDAAREALCASALEQPQVWVHRDYHSRNLMVTPEDNPGVLDFQDAVIGPVTYDLVSLLRDCYMAWPRERVEGWALAHRARLIERGLALPGSTGDFLRHFDLMGVQRHLKAIGIFARLNHRDGKPGYLGDIPRTLGYVLEVAGRRRELRAFGELLAARVVPALRGRGAA